MSRHPVFVSILKKINLPIISAFLCCQSLALAGQPVVRLLIPVDNGSEFEQVKLYVEQPKIFVKDSKTYILLGAFANALHAYNLGLSLQKVLKLPFELDYDYRHPQSDLAWFRSLSGNSASASSSRLKSSGSDLIAKPSSASPSIKKYSPNNSLLVQQPIGSIHRKFFEEIRLPRGDHINFSASADINSLPFPTSAKQKEYPRGIEDQPSAISLKTTVRTTEPVQSALLSSPPLASPDLNPVSLVDEVVGNLSLPPSGYSYLLVRMSDAERPSRLRELLPSLRFFKSGATIVGKIGSYYTRSKLGRDLLSFRESQLLSRGVSGIFVAGESELVSSSHRDLIPPAHVDDRYLSASYSCIDGILSAAVKCSKSSVSFLNSSIKQDKIHALSLPAGVSVSLLVEQDDADSPLASSVEVADLDSKCTHSVTSNSISKPGTPPSHTPSESQSVALAHDLEFYNSPLRPPIYSENVVGLDVSKAATETASISVFETMRESTANV